MTFKGEIRYKMDEGVGRTFSRLEKRFGYLSPKRSKVGDFVVPFRQETMIMIGQIVISYFKDIFGSLYRY